MVNTPVVARTDKSGTRKLCGRIGADGRHCCGQELMETITGVETVPPIWIFRPGWSSEPDGVWRLSPSARARWERSRVIASGNARWDDGDVDRERARLSQGTAERTRKPITAPYTYAPGLPARAQCPACCAVNCIESN